jgi:SAM-dependent methyltransferase
MMFVPDKVAAYREAKRVLRPSGTLVFNVWGPLHANGVSELVSDAVARALPDDPPRFFERTPFGYHDAQAITGELRRAGFARVELETIAKVTRARSCDSVAIGLCQGTPLRNEIESRAPGRLGEITELVKQSLALRFGQGAFENRMEALVITATSE